MEVKKIYTSHISPFEIAFFDIGKKKIYIDKKMKKSEHLNYLLEHETEHSKSKNLIDWRTESKVTFSVFYGLLKVKPLWFFSPIIPILWVKERNKLNFGLDLFRLFNFSMFFMIISLVIALKVGALI